MRHPPNPVQYERKEFFSEEAFPNISLPELEQSITFYGLMYPQGKRINLNPNLFHPRLYFGSSELTQDQLKFLGHSPECSQNPWDTLRLL